MQKTWTLICFNFTRITATIITTRITIIKLIIIITLKTSNTKINIIYLKKIPIY